MGAALACRSAAARADDGTLELWTSETEPVRLATMNYLAAAYRAWADGPRIVIRSIDEHRIVGAVLQAPPHQRPDIVNTAGDLLLSLDRLGLADQSAQAEVVSRVGALRFFPGVLAGFRLADGAIAAIPFHGWPQVLWYRRHWFEDAGLSPPDTIAALERAVAVLHRPDRGRVGIVLGTDDGHYTQQFFAQLARTHGARLFLADGTPHLDTPEVREALACYARLAAFGPPGQHNWRARDWYLRGRAAVMVYSTLIMDDLALSSVAAGSLRGASFPGLDPAPFDPGLVAGTGQVTNVAGVAEGVYAAINGLGVTALDPARSAAAVRFIEFLFRPDAYIVWLHMSPGGMLPVLQGVAESDAFLRDPAGVLQRFGRARIKALAEALALPGAFSHWGGRVVPEAGTAYADGLVSRMVVRVLDGADPAASAAAAQSEAEELLQESASSGSALRRQAPTVP